MVDNSITINPNDILVIPDVDHDRYASFGFISWWDQEKIRQATVLVAGAGALGNEVIKNLALIGIGRLLIIDFDTIEHANLSRSILFRERDNGRSKAEVAAQAVKEINPDVQVKWIHGDLTREVGLGVFRHVDAVIGCLDNREARLFINRACWKVGQPWVDGAIQELLGEARVFWPGQGPCYECTLGPADYEAMNRRYSCSSLARDLYMEGKIATTPTIAAIVSGMQTQEALKLIHGMEVRPGTAVVFNGLTNDVYNINYNEKEDCLSHHAYDPIRECPDLSAVTTTLYELLAYAKNEVGETAIIELDFDLLVKFECVECETITDILQPATTVKESTAICPNCGAFCWSHQTYLIDGSEDFLDKRLAEIGIPPLHIVVILTSEAYHYFELSGDRKEYISFA